jgi:hypothetical protein
MMIKDTPEGLYGEPGFWMEGEVLKGLNAHYSCRLIKTPCSCRPMDGSIIQPFNELLVFVGETSRR